MRWLKKWERLKANKEKAWGNHEHEEKGNRPAYGPSSSSSSSMVVGSVAPFFALGGGGRGDSFGGETLAAPLKLLPKVPPFDLAVVFCGKSFAGKSEQAYLLSERYRLKMCRVCRTSCVEVVSCPCGSEEEGFLIFYVSFFVSFFVCLFDNPLTNQTHTSPSSLAWKPFIEPFIEPLSTHTSSQPINAEKELSKALSLAEEFGVGSISEQELESARPTALQHRLLVGHWFIRQAVLDRLGLRVESGKVLAPCVGRRAASQAALGAAAGGAFKASTCQRCHHLD
jgi:hypothetical protein